MGSSLKDGAKNKGLKLLKVFLKKIFKNSLDLIETNRLVGPLSSTRKLFEIYFVRLIGTPNQNSKMVSALWGMRPSKVVHESLGF